MRKFLDVCYTAEKHPMQMLNIYLPESESFPVFVYFHGGGLVAGDRTACPEAVQYLTENGVAVVNVEYRMYPDAKYPDFIYDSAAAVKWTKENLGGDLTDGKIFVGGSSAGGYLSMMLCFDKRYFEADRKSVV